MTEPSDSPLLTERVSSLSWEELQSASLSAAKCLPGGGGQEEAGPAPETDGITAAALPPASLAAELAGAALPLVMESVRPQLDIAVEAAVSNAASRLRRDLDRALEAAVRAAVEKAIREKLEAGR